MRWSRVRVNLIGENLGRNTREGKIEAQTAKIFRESNPFKKVLARLVVGANVDEGGVQAGTVEETVKNGHGFSVI
jgi:hypothetical protein